MRSARSQVIAGIVLAGGASRRMGGIDKATLPVAGVPLLDRVLAAARPVCERLVVVGPERPTTVDGVLFVEEAEPGGGPVPAIRAGVDAAPGCDVVVVLATDLPLLTAAHLRRLVAAFDDPSAEAAAAAGAKGPNPLLAGYRVPSLIARSTGLGAGTPAARLLPADVVTVDLAAAGFNVNEPEDLAAADLLFAHTDGVITTALWLRRLVRDAVPDAVESVYEGWHGFGYRHPDAGYFCAVFPRQDDVKLSFEHGARLIDPRGLLQGGGRQVRHVDVSAPGQPPAEHLVELIDAAVT